jgi:hypothetical protein
LRHLIPLLFCILFFICVGILAIVRPEEILRWAEQAHPDIYVDEEARRSLIVIAKLIGTGFLVFMVPLSILIVWSF